MSYKEKPGDASSKFLKEQEDTSENELEALASQPIHTPSSSNESFAEEELDPPLVV